MFISKEATYIYLCHTPVDMPTWKTEARKLSHKFEIGDQLRHPSEISISEKRHNNRASITLWENPGVLVFTNLTQTQRSEKREPQLRKMLPSDWPVCGTFLFVFWFLEIWFLYVTALAVLELTMWSRMASNSQRSACLCRPESPTPGRTFS